MKRIHLCAALLLFAAAACTPATNDNAGANANASNTNAANSNTTGAAAWTNDDVIANERQAWDWIKAKNSDALAAALDENFIEVTPVGVHTKAQTVAYVKTFDLTEVNLSDFKVLKLDNDAAVVAYTVSMKGSVGGKPIPANAPAERHATAKVWRGGKWLAVFHQLSTVEPPMTPAGGANANSAAPAKNANAASTAKNANDSAKNANDGARNVNVAGDGARNANAATNGSAAPLATTADAEADERMVWDAFEKKNIDGFAAILTDDFFEVEPDGVYTRAASLDALRQMVNAVAYKGTLSDFKTVTLDEDAKIVTYVAKSNAKGFPPAGMRHSSVWVNRAGKWMAAYHQGTGITRGM